MTDDQLGRIVFDAFRTDPVFGEQPGDDASSWEDADADEYGRAFRLACIRAAKAVVEAGKETPE